MIAHTTACTCKTATGQRNLPIRPARMSDVKEIHSLLQRFAAKGLLLGRSISSLYDQLRDFVVFDDNGIQGVCSLHICWENLAEIRSLAVAEQYHGKGIGRQLVYSCLDEARSLEIAQVFTLTYQAAFFNKLNFHPIEKNDLPHKIWSDCLQCPKFPDCDEEALIWTAKKK
ncbi:MAG: N-acetyltransferase [Candidatus Electrothrix aestuarii]|uniref:N-acetyltransferase n=1 Tax=Candidatus Electrothrix aestuarii TaxID=3062594 RepID=A0AAU8LWN7_9BACT|nr:N-acetyltransferase [Candidatus Electrothrix aestuarii]